MPQIEVETHKVAAPDVVVPTLDTVRHESLLYTWLAEHKPIGKFFRFFLFFQLSRGLIWILFTSSTVTIRFEFLLELIEIDKSSQLYVPLFSL